MDESTMEVKPTDACKARGYYFLPPYTTDTETDYRSSVRNWK
jgi:hypothetical protein